MTNSSLLSSACDCYNLEQSIKKFHDLCALEVQRLSKVASLSFWILWFQTWKRGNIDMKNLNGNKSKEPKNCNREVALKDDAGNQPHLVQIGFKLTVSKLKSHKLEVLYLKVSQS